MPSNNFNSIWPNHQILHGEETKNFNHHKTVVMWKCGQEKRKKALDDEQDSKTKHHVSQLMTVVITLFLV